MRIQMEVTSSDIRWGELQDSNTCPIARSVKRTLGLRGKQADRLRVMQEAVEFEREDDDRFAAVTQIAVLPAKANTFMHDFDHNLPVKPFSFFANFSLRAAKSVGLTLPKA